MTKPTPRETIAAIFRLANEWAALDPDATTIRIGDIPDWGIRAARTDGETVSGGDGHQSPTESVAMRAFPDEHGRIRTEGALADSDTLRKLHDRIASDLAASAAIMRRYPVQMPRKEHELDAPASNCGICTRPVLANTADPMKLIKHPTVGMVDTPACIGCFKAWEGLCFRIESGGGAVDGFTFREWRQAQRNAVTYGTAERAS